MGVVPLGTLFRHSFTRFFNLFDNCLSISAILRRIRFTTRPSRVTWKKESFFQIAWPVSIGHTPFNQAGLITNLWVKGHQNSKWPSTSSLEGSHNITKPMNGLRTLNTPLNRSSDKSV